MNSATDPVLELLDDVGIAISQAAIIHEIAEKRDSVSAKTIRRAINELEEKKYIVRPKDDSILFEITDRGRDYLSGERDGRDDE